MNDKRTFPIPEPITNLQRQLDQFRSGQPKRTKLPESLWQAAAELARQYGVYTVAHPLRLDYMALKKRLGESSARQPKTTQSAFIELIAPTEPKLDECIVEFESPSRGKRRIQWRATAPPDWSSLLRAWRESER
jgi:hypothetical protein